MSSDRQRSLFLRQREDLAVAAVRIARADWQQFILATKLKRRLAKEALWHIREDGIEIEWGSLSWSLTGSGHGKAVRAVERYWMEEYQLAEFGKTELLVRVGLSWLELDGKYVACKPARRRIQRHSVTSPPKPRPRRAWEEIPTGDDAAVHDAAELHLRIAELNAASTQPPARIETIATRIERNGELARLLKELYQQTCQICGYHKRTASGSAVIDVHHIERLADGGLDVSRHMLVVCPSCHRWLHLAAVEKVSHTAEELILRVDDSIIDVRFK